MEKDGTARAVALIGAPSSAGAYAPGPEDTPAAIRDAGFATRLGELGVAVEDVGDTPRFRWRPDRVEPRAMHVAPARAAALAVADRVAAALERGQLPVVLGGDCTVELGTVLGWQRHRAATALVYVDPHPDLNTPDSVPDGALSWMGLAHLLGEAGARRELVDLGGRVPALAADDVLLFGYSPDRATEAERATIARRRLATVEEAAVADDPARAAARALDWVADRGPFLVHLDTDSVDFADLPLAENTDRNVGLAFADVAAALDVLLAAPALGALTVTQLNPHHGEPDGSTLAPLVECLATGLAAHGASAGGGR